MLIAGIDTTGVALSVALIENNVLLGETFLHGGKKHLATLMPALQGLYEMTGRSVQQTDVFGLSIGPGSFTGIRIGAAAVQALAQSTEKPVAQVDSLRALCENMPFEGVRCAVMDARRGEVYAAAYRGDYCILPAQAISLSDLLAALPKEPVLFFGDGVPAYGDQIRQEFSNAVFAPQELLYQRGASVCRVAAKMVRTGQLSRFDEITPRYLRLSQAERMKQERNHEK